MPAAVRVVRSASIESVLGGLRGLLVWCRVVRIELKLGGGTGSGERVSWRPRVLNDACRAISTPSAARPGSC